MRRAPSSPQSASCPGSWSGSAATAAGPARSRRVEVGDRDRHGAQRRAGSGPARRLAASERIALQELDPVSLRVANAGAPLSAFAQHRADGRRAEGGQRAERRVEAGDVERGAPVAVVGRRLVRAARARLRAQEAEQLDLHQLASVHQPAGGEDRVGEPVHLPGERSGEQRRAAREQPEAGAVPAVHPGAAEVVVGELAEGEGRAHARRLWIGPVARLTSRDRTSTTRASRRQRRAAARARARSARGDSPNQRRHERLSVLCSL